MKLLQTTRNVLIVPPISINGANATLINLVDLGDVGAPYSEVEITIDFGTMAADATALIIKEHTATIASAGSSANWITASTTVTGGTFTVANLSAANAAGKRFVCYVPVGGTRKRYLGVLITAGAGATLVTASARGVVGAVPNSVTELNVVEALYPSA